MKFSPATSYDMRFKEDLEAILAGLSTNLHLAATMDEARASRLLNIVLERACQCQNARNITLGREAFMELPRQWVLDRIEKAAFQLLNWDNDDWEYRRLVEVAEELDSALVARLVQRGLESQNPEVVEAARDYL